METERSRNVQTRRITAADQRYFVASPKQWQSFLEILDRPARVKPKLAHLISEQGRITAASSDERDTFRKPR